MVERLSFKQKFIVFGVSLLFVLLLGYYAYSMFSSRDKIYHVNFKCSVNGLKEGSCVTYKGVEVGTVSAMRIELPDADVVKVSIRIKHYFPVYSNYSAALSSRGFTGYYAIDLNKEEGEQIEMASGSFIQYKPSSLEEILQNVPEVVKEAKIFFKNVNNALTEREIKQIVERMEIFTWNIKEFSESLNNLLEKGSSDSIKLFGAAQKNLKTVEGASSKLGSDYKKLQVDFLGRIFILSNFVELLSHKFTKKTGANTGAWKFFN